MYSQEEKIYLDKEGSESVLQSLWTTLEFTWVYRLSHGVRKDFLISKNKVHASVLISDKR